MQNDVVIPAFDSLLGIREAARRLGISVRTLRNWTQANRIPYLRLLDKTIKFRHADLDKFITDAVVPAKVGA